MSLKALADAVLTRNARRNNHATSVEHDVQLVAVSDRERLRGLNLDELRHLAGKDWPELQENPALLECFADMVAVRKMRERGETPSHYTAVTTCRHCGPVPIFPGVPDHVDGCPWCLNRAAGLPVPPAKKKPTAPGAKVSVPKTCLGISGVEIKPDPMDSSTQRQKQAVSDLTWYANNE